MNKKLVILVSTVLTLSTVCVAQKNVAGRPTPSTAAADLQPIRSSPAYADLLLQKTELQSTLDALLVDYTEEYPKVKDTRSQLRLLQTEMDRLLAVKPENVTRLSDALGRLMLRKVELEAQLEMLRTQYKDDHPDVKKLKQKVDRYESAIREILG